MAYLLFAPSKASSDQDNNSRRTPMMRVLDFGRSFDYPTVATAKCRLQSCTSPPEQSNPKPWWSRTLTVTKEVDLWIMCLLFNVQTDCLFLFLLNVCVSGGGGWGWGGGRCRNVFY